MNSPRIAASVTVARSTTVPTFSILIPVTQHIRVSRCQVGVEALLCSRDAVAVSEVEIDGIPKLSMQEVTSTA